MSTVLLRRIGPGEVFQQQRKTLKGHSRSSVIKCFSRLKRLRQQSY